MDIDRWLLQTAALLLFGAYFFVTGRWPRRKGTDPHCRKCEYNLALCTSARCPECGSPLLGSAIAIGQRTRVAWRIWSGVGCGVIAAGGIVWVASTTLRLGELNAWIPSAWLLEDAAHAQSSRAIGALQELSHRALGEKLTTDELRELADVCLVIQADEFTPQAERVPLYGLLEWFARTDRFTDAQWKQFADIYFDRSVAVPPIVPLDAYNTIWVAPRWSSLPVFGELTWRSVTVDGQEVVRPRPAPSQSTLERNRDYIIGPASSLRADLPPCPQLGTHAVNLTFDLTFYRIQSGTFDRNDPLHTIAFAHDATVHVVEIEEYRRAVVAALQDSLRVMEVVALSTGPVFAVAVEPVRPMPCYVELKVSLEGSAAQKPGWMSAGFCKRLWFDLPYGGRRPEKFTVVIDLQTRELYAGDAESNARLQLRFPDLKITRRVP